MLNQPIPSKSCTPSDAIFGLSMGISIFALGLLVILPFDDDFDDITNEF